MMKITVHTFVITIINCNNINRINNSGLAPASQILITNNHSQVKCHLFQDTVNLQNTTETH